MAEFKIGDRVICKPPVDQSHKWEVSLWGKRGTITGFASCNIDKGRCNQGCLNSCMIEVAVDDDIVRSAVCYGYSCRGFQYYAWEKIEEEGEVHEEVSVKPKSKFNYLEINI